MNAVPRVPQTFVVTLLPAEQSDVLPAVYEDVWRGKVVHIASGEQALFTSLRQMLRFMRRCIGDDASVSAFEEPKDNDRHD